LALTQRGKTRMGQVVESGLRKKKNVDVSGVGLSFCKLGVGKRRHRFLILGHYSRADVSPINEITIVWAQPPSGKSSKFVGVKDIARKVRALDKSGGALREEPGFSWAKEYAGGRDLIIAVGYEIAYAHAGQQTERNHDDDREHAPKARSIVGTSPSTGFSLTEDLSKAAAAYNDDYDRKHSDIAQMLNGNVKGSRKYQSSSEITAP